jgi:arylsulfatase A-like enzyme/multidrug efflux pump subunit AcrA (membrane-fusion protein)
VNIIFISMDTLRGDRLSCVGHPRGLTPNLDRIAAEGSLFTSAFASDIPTQPSHTAVFTGRFGINSEIVSHYHPSSFLDENVSWLPTIFQQKGYATCAVDHLFSMKGWFVRGYTDYMSPPGRSRAPGSTINNIAYPWIEKKTREDFFLFLHFWDPHIPYVPPSPFREKLTSQSASWVDPLLMQRLRSRPTYPLFKRNLYDHLEAKPNLDYIADLYDAEVAYLDFEINRLFERLDDLGILDDTMVVMFGDHGENMTEHDAWFDHAGLYDSVVHVPLIMWRPGLVPQARVESMVQLVDVKPTVLDLVGLPPVDGMDGRSLLPVMKGEVSTHRDAVYLSECTWQAKRAIRTEDWKFIHCTDPGVYPRSEDELYDLRNDPEEQKNVALEYPDVAAQLGDRLHTWVGEQLAGRPDPMNQVIADGLPAVVRLDGVINEAEREAHQVPDNPTDEHPVVAPMGAMVATSTLPTAAVMTPSSGAVVPAGAAPPDKKRLNRRRAIFVAVAAVLAVLALIFAVNSILGGNLQAAGVLQPAQSVDLNFPTTGPINTLWVAPGQSVHKGEILATQDTTALNSKLAADQAKLDADYTVLVDGPTPNQTAQQLQSKVQQAQAALTAAQGKAASQSALDSLAVTNAQSAVTSAQATLNNDQQAATAACSGGPQFSTVACDTATHQDSVDQAQLTSAQGAYQQAVQTQRSDASSSQNAIAEAQAAVSSAQADDAAGTQPQNATQVSSEQASVHQDQATLSADKKAIALAQVVAPFAGTVAGVNGTVGDLAGPNGVQQQAPQGGVSQPSSGITLFPSAPQTQTSRTPQQASLITLGSRQMTVVVQVGESDIGQVHVGQSAQVTFPAQPGTVYDARVSTVNPTAVNQSGSVYFLVELRLVSGKDQPLPGPSKLKGLSGLSADVTFN